MAFLANGNTPTRGPYADNVRKIERYLIGCGTSSGDSRSNGRGRGSGTVSAQARSQTSARPAAARVSLTAGRIRI